MLDFIVFPILNLFNFLLYQEIKLYCARMAATCSQSLVGGQGANSFKIDVGSPLWKHTSRISQVFGCGSLSLEV